MSLLFHNWILNVAYDILYCTVDFASAQVSSFIQSFMFLFRSSIADASLHCISNLFLCAGERATVCSCQSYFSDVKLQQPISTQALQCSDNRGKFVNISPLSALLNFSTRNCSHIGRGDISKTLLSLV